MRWDTGGGCLGIFCIAVLLYIAAVLIFAAPLCVTDLGDCLR
jgi:uncharacterized membrane protein